MLIILLVWAVWVTNDRKSNQLKEKNRHLPHGPKY